MNVPGNMPASLAAQISSALGKDEKKLLKSFKALSAENRQSLLAFAEFLVTRDQQEVARSVIKPLAEPVFEAGPEDESVIKAIKRLGRIYTMIDRSILLNDTSSLMTRHLMQGVPAADIIVELENLFKKTYESLSDQHAGEAES